MKINIKTYFSQDKFQVEVPYQGSMADLFQAIQTLAAGNNSVIDKVVFAGKALEADDSIKVEKKLHNLATVHLISTPNLTTDEWITYAREHTQVRDLGPLKAVATPESGTFGRTLNHNWGRYSQAQQDQILSELSTAESGSIKIYQTKYPTEHNVGRNPTIYYSSEHLDRLLSKQYFDMPLEDVLERLTTFINYEDDPTFSSLIYVLFGDAADKGSTAAKDAKLTKGVKKTYDRYIKSLKKSPKPKKGKPVQVKKGKAPKALNVHKLTPKILDIAKREAYSIQEWVLPHEHDQLIGELKDRYHGNKMALKAINSMAKEYKPENGGFADQELGDLNVTGLLKATWELVKDREVGLDTTLEEIGRTCVQGQSHRLLSLYVAVKESITEAPPS